MKPEKKLNTKKKYLSYVIENWDDELKLNIQNLSKITGISEYYIRQCKVKELLKNKLYPTSS